MGAKLGIESVSEVRRKGRPRWFTHEERIELESWMKRSIYMNLEGRVLGDKPS